MISQDDFDQFVSNYNNDYQYLLTRASRGSYDCLISSFIVLKDLHDVIMKLHETTQLEFRVVAYPLTFRGSDAFLRGLGFDGEEIARIYGFLRHVKLTQGKEFEECVEEGVAFCGVGAPPQQRNAPDRDS
ncbi:MAG TPA: hypothetical protein VD968_03070 [Pyrinomonadaceae bacterium]|nr:hypothetical protein [Pyrinomonadaceae bacterium]